MVIILVEMKLIGYKSKGNFHLGLLKAKVLLIQTFTSASFSLKNFIFKKNLILHKHENFNNKYLHFAGEQPKMRKRFIVNKYFFQMKETKIQTELPDF